MLAAVGLAVSDHAVSSPAAPQRAVRRVVREVAEYLGNTPAVCRASWVCQVEITVPASYIDGRLIDRYMDGETVQFPHDRLGAGVRAGWPATSGGFEAAVIRLLHE